MNKVGLLGGSFDPIHKGHIGIALKVREELNLDEVWFIPAKNPNLKDDLSVDFSNRLKMIEIAIKDYPFFRVLDIESKLPTPSYTVNTLKKLIKDYPNNQYYFIIGSDQKLQLNKWHKIEELKQIVKFVTISRGEDLTTDIVVDSDLFPESSSGFKKGNVEYLDLDVWNYIVANRLYLKELVKNQMSEKRYNHSISVLETSLLLAQAHNLDYHKTYLAALFHDIAKELSDQEMMSYLNEVELKCPKAIWHQFAGAKLVRDKYLIDDEDVFLAIYFHAVGGEDNPYVKLTYCADKIEPTRKYETQHMIDACLEDLDKGYLLVDSEKEKKLKCIPKEPL